ncbi:MAG: DNA-binding protein, partial [Tannerellaceae bacterium]|nr:DNA-binding protein [Tannerellaceae bacterium]
RVVTDGTINIDELARYIHEICTLTTADIKASLVALVEVMADELASGRRIRLDGLGYFNLTLASPPIDSPKEIRAESVHVRSIAFRPEESFKKRFRGIPLKRSKEKRHSNHYSIIEIDGLLTGYFLDNTHITRRMFCALCGFTESTGRRRLHQLIAEGKLRKTGYANLPLYEPVKGNYRR